MGYSVLLAGMVIMDGEKLNILILELSDSVQKGSVLHKQVVPIMRERKKA
jgi:hypothetical protein